jgi:hypothetical protein
MEVAKKIRAHEFLGIRLSGVWGLLDKTANSVALAGG